MPMTPPDATAIRATSQSPFPEQGYPAPTSPAADPLARIVTQANAFVLLRTGWLTFPGVPDGYAPLVYAAIQGLTEMYVQQTTPEYLDTLSDFDLIQSFTAGGYSETRHEPPTSGSRGQAIKLALAAWPNVQALIIAAMSPEALEEWIAYLEGRTVPSFEVVPVDWDYHGGLYGSQGGEPPYPFSRPIWGDW
jgi:hypothetical protein